MNRRLHFRPHPDRTLLVAGIVTVAVLAGLALLALTAQRGLPVKSYYSINADFRDAGEINDYSDVRIAGKLVGQVLGSSSEHGVATVQLQLMPSVEPLRSGTTARIRLQGLLGAKYVELDPSARGVALRNGATIPVSRTSTTVDIFHVIQAFDGKRQADLRAVLGSLGEGFLSRGDQLNGALADAPGLVQNIGRVTQAVASEPAAAERLVPAAQSLSAAIDPVRADLANGFEPEANAIRPFASERQAVQRTLGEAPTALPDIQQGLAEADPLLRQTAGFARAAISLTRPAPAALQSATMLLRASPGPLRQTRTLLGELDTAIPPTLRLTAALDPLIAPTQRVLTNAVPILSSLGARSCDLLGMWRNWRSLLGFGVPGDNPIGPEDTVRVGVALNADALTSGSAKPSALVGHDPYAPPCTAAQEHLQ